MEDPKATVKDGSFTIPPQYHAMAAELAAKLLQSYSPAATDNFKPLKLACFAHWPRFCEHQCELEKATFLHAEEDLGAHIARLDNEGKDWIKVSNNLEAATAVAVFGKDVTIITKGAGDS
ncbi:hypothetical protein LPJ55_001730 [Coemansia sp. RSA 990]|nr:hypothetical protein LPJ68_001828 [Coemansia sp. RSA 1086]KAJ1751221.1 hypothetical protein LPJ79_002252 [Coemansia sp. RSA 1821]KAJ1874130.1 hypothetical protein LPJ55_001730 [Coemansia sp. RSA 990]KAJ2653335.1 hypothetical protein IWW40_000388 [Coemansia sp. RSA 1250]